MIARLRDETGITVLEATMAAVMMVVVLGAALAPFDLMHRTERRAANQNDSQDGARNAMAGIVRNLRNTSGQNQLVNMASPYDMVVETVDPAAKPAGSQNARNLMRVRYCLDTTSQNTSLTNGVVWEQTHKWTTATPPSMLPIATCPDAGWGASRIVAEHVTNKATWTGRPTAAPLFTFFPNSTSLDTITAIRINLYSDYSWAENPAETQLASGVLLRNQNGSPTASFTATPGTVGSLKLTLNAGTSTDPEGLPLTYRWCDVTTQTVCDDTTRVGTDVLYTYTAPSAGARKIQLQVFDVGGLQAVANLTVSAP
jgi:hypothetical protein